MSEWKQRPLHEVVVIERISVDASAIADGTIYVGLENINSGGGFANVQSVASGELASSKFSFTERHVLYGKLRPYLAKIARPSFSGVCSTDILPILPKPELDRDYLTHFLRQPTMIEYANSRATGANLPRLSPKTLADFQIPLPPLSEQKGIAAILDQADALRAKRRQTIEKLDTLTQSIFLDMFGDANRLGWPEKAITAVSDRIRTGPFGSQLLHSEFVGSGIAVLGIDNAVNNQFAWARPRYITMNKFQQLKRYKVSPGDVLITIMGTCGRCAIVPDDVPLAINTKHLCCITLDPMQCLPEYLHACFLRHPRVLTRLGVRVRGAVMPGLNMQVIKELVIPLPPLPVQNEFAEWAKAIERLKQTQRASLAKLDELFGSLQQRAFKGELQENRK